MNSSLHSPISPRLVALLLASITASSTPALYGQFIDLGSASSFSVLANTAVTNVGASVLSGNLGSMTVNSVTGFPPGLVGGTIYNNDATTSGAIADAETAFAQLGSLIPTAILTGQDIGSFTRTPGVYFYGVAASLTGTLTLDGQNTINPLFVFQIGSTLTTGSSSIFNLINGAKAENVWFRVGSSATLGTTSVFNGNIVARTSNTVTTGVIIDGRIIALDGAVALDNNQIMTVPEPAAYTLLGASAVLGFIFMRRRTARHAV